MTASRFSCGLLLLLLATPGVSYAAPESNPDEILVSTDTASVTRLDFEAEIAQVPEEYRGRLLSSKKLVSQLLETMLVNKTHALAARSAGLDKDPLIQRQMEQASDKLLSRLQMERSAQALVFPDFNARARELYLSDKSKYTKPGQVSVSHILLDSSQHTDDEEAVALLQEYRQRILNGESIEAIAVEYSEDPSVASNKGFLGFVTADQMVKPFANAAFAMQNPGDISEPVRTRFGFHLIQLHEKIAAEEIPFETVRDSIIEQLKSEYVKQHQVKERNDILRDPSIRLNEEVIDSYVLSPVTVMP